MSRGENSGRRWLVRGAVIFGLWTLVGAFGAANSYASLPASSEGREWIRFFWPRMLGVWIWAAMTPLALSFSSRFRFERQNWRSSLLAHILLSQVFVAGVVFAEWVLFPLILGYARGGYFYRFGHELWLNTFTFVGLVLVAHSLSYYRLFREQEMKSVRLESALAETRLRALRSHLHPHFLFNTISAAAELTHENPEAADRMLTRLSQLLQRAFLETQVAQVPLEREISFAEQYLEIARIRFGDRLTTRVTVSPEVRRALVPSFVLQPLVENAIHHGVERVEGPVEVSVWAVPEDERLVIRVSDTGPGLAEEPEEIQWRTGLGKVKGLLEELYPDGHQLRLSNGDGGGTVMEIHIPLLLDPGEDREERIPPSAGA